MITRKVFITSAFITMFCLSFTCEADDLSHPSFDCNKATTSVEQIICHYPPLGLLDSAMSAYFNQAKNTASLKQQQILLNNQRLWLKNRAATCQVSSQLDFNQTQWENYIDCLSTLYKNRNYFLFSKAFSLEQQPFFTTLTGDIDFAPFSVTGPVSKKEIELLYATEIIPGGYKGTQDSSTLYNCNDLNSHSINPDNTIDEDTTSQMSMTCDILDQLSKLKTPKIDFIHNTHLSDIQYIPFSFLPSMVDDDDAQIDAYQKKGLALEDLIKQGIVKIHINSPTSINIYFNGNSAYINEIVRGDFLGNGRNSILISIIDHAGGTLATSTTAVISRTGENQKFQIDWQNDDDN